MTGILYSFIDIFLVSVILLAMVMVLLGIRRLFNVHEFDDSERTVRLRDDVRKRHDVISQDSVFHRFLARNSSDVSKNDGKDHKGEGRYA